MEQTAVANPELPGTGRTVSILGVPLSYGQSKGGVHLGPAAIRVSGVAERIAKLGFEVNDRGDLPIQRGHSLPGFDDKLKYLPEIYDACSRLAEEIESIVDAGEFPITIGGDHSIAIGSPPRVGKGFSQRNEKVRLFYFFCYCDPNT